MSLASIVFKVLQGHKPSYLPPDFGLLPLQSEGSLSLLGSNELLFMKESCKP